MCKDIQNIRRYKTIIIQLENREINLIKPVVNNIGDDKSILQGMLRNYIQCHSLNFEKAITTCQEFKEYVNWKLIIITLRNLKQNL